MIVGVLCVGVFATSPRQEAAPAHLAQARTLVTALQGSPENLYGGGKRFIDWGVHPVTARTVCSSFATLLFQHTYQWDNGYIRAWFGMANPEAEQYHDAIAAKKGFQRIVNVDSIRPGDILAIKYTDGHRSRNGVQDTGHVMLVDRIDKNRGDQPPIVPGTNQYFVSVIDSSATGHGVSDTRHIGPNKFSGGIGRGVFRIYADQEGHIAGYAWSDERRSPFYSAPARDLVVGRLKRPD